VRRAGAELSRSTRERALTALRALPDGARARLLRALALDASVARALEEQLRSTGARERAHAALAAEALGDTRLTAPVLAALTRERDPSAARAAFRAALRLSARAPEPLLDRALSDDELAAEALETLARTERELPERLRVQLRRALDPERAPRTRAAAAYALAASEGSRAFSALHARIDDSVPRVRRAIIGALASLCEPGNGRSRACSALENLARVEPKGAVRSWARRSLKAKHEPPASRDVLDVLVRDAVRSPDLTEVEIELPDGKSLYVLPLTTGELLVPDLPTGPLEVRLQPRLGGEAGS